MIQLMNYHKRGVDMMDQVLKCDFCSCESNGVSAHNGNLFCDECFEAVVVIDSDLMDDIL